MTNQDQQCSGYGCTWCDPPSLRKHMLRKRKRVFTLRPNRSSKHRHCKPEHPCRDCRKVDSRKRRALARGLEKNWNRDE